MKLENTLENKERFLAQYWGQKCGKNKYCNLSVNKSNILNITHLELKSLSQISDEDCILIFNKFYTDSNLYSDTKKIYDIKNAIKSNFSEDVVFEEDFIFYTDYLRSKGYALPYMDLSVEDLVEYGWVKLKEN